MTTFDFINYFNDNIWLYFAIAIPIVWLYIRVANKLATSWLNPIKINVFTAGIGISVAIFMYAIDEANLQTLAYVLTSSILFWGILVLYCPKETKKLNLRIVDEYEYSFYLFLIFYWGNILLTLFSYKEFGIPIFSDDSRLSTFTGSGGFGIILRVSGFFSIYSIFYLFMKYDSKRITFRKLCLYLSPPIVFGVLSGSRSSFLVYIFAYWGFNKFYLGKDIQLLKYRKLLIPFIAISLFTFALESATDLIGGINHFMERVIACGDLYWYALPDDTWADITNKTPIKDVLVNFLGPFRIITEAECDVPIGYQLTQFVYTDFFKMTGPVDLFPISSLVYFGKTGGYFFTVFQAFIACFTLKLFYRKCDSLIIASLCYFAFLKSVDFVGSFKYASGQMFDVLLNAAVVFLIGLILAFFKKIRNR